MMKLIGLIIAIIVVIMVIPIFVKVVLWGVGFWLLCGAMGYGIGRVRNNIMSTEIFYKDPLFYDHLIYGLVSLLSQFK